MERVLERCAGLDVHKKTVTVCARVPDTSGGRAQQVRTFEADIAIAHAMLVTAYHPLGSPNDLPGPGG